MQKWIFIFLLSTSYQNLLAQDHGPAVALLKIASQDEKPLSQTTVELMKKKDSSLVKMEMTDTSGALRFSNIPAGEYFVRVTRIGYINYSTPSFSLEEHQVYVHPIIVLVPSNTTMAGITVTGRKPFIEQEPGKTVINLDASISTVGTTAMEALEKLPGITIDKDGNISLKGKSGVTVMIDGKPSYLGSAELATMLSGMNASQISQVELLDQPPAKYDAAGSGGIINVKTKKNRQKGWNAALTFAYGQGRYPKNNNSLQLNFRSGRWNVFTNYSMNFNRSFTRLYALRKYFDKDGLLVSQLEQPSLLTGQGLSHNIKAGVDYDISDKTTIGINLTGFALERKGKGDNTGLWMDEDGKADSLIKTYSSNHNNWRNAGVNLNFRHDFTKAEEISIDMDVIGYKIRGDQFFQNVLVMPGGYSEASRANLPSDIHIYSAKADYSRQLKNFKVEAGTKTAHVTTDNLAAYEYNDGSDWKPDYGKTNHFLYKEDIHALYATAETRIRNATVQGGLRYESTRYDGTQLGNIVQKDSSFSRRYSSLFPSLLASFTVDSSNSLSFSAGRRIDRPAFQKLNPFIFIINKYTYQQGNPFFRPQYTWNFEVTHQFRQLLTTALSYSITKDYFSQIFPLDTTGIVIYTEGNLGRLRNLGLSIAVQAGPLKWWSFTAQGIVNHKKMEGTITKFYEASITQFTINVNNQVRFGKGWTGELSGFYASRSQQDIQEVVDPSGQLTVGVSKPAFSNKATFRLSLRDIFYTQAMAGLTQFGRANEYFKLTRDTRVCTLSFTYRLGKAYKSLRRLGGASGEEIQRVGNG
jgi:iron complex outermembrane receptor protein